MFYDKSIEVWKQGEPVSLGGGVYQPGVPELAYKTKVDIQPYSSAQAKRDYGYDVETTNRMFAKPAELIIGKNFIKYKDYDYDVVEIIEWDRHIEVMLNRKW